MDVAVAQRSAAGEVVSGDECAVVREGATCLIAVIDGLGHGSEAHREAQIARRAIEVHHRLDLKEIFDRIARDLSAQRGACVALLRIHTDTGRLECASVGNVEIVASSRVPIHPVSSPGIVGRHVRKIHFFEYPLTAGDRLVVFSDGISRRFDLLSYRNLSAREAAQAILQQHGLPHDDATCVVVDFA